MPGCLKEDLFRRDFVINSMAACINRKYFGEIVDYYGGLEDLKKKRIRVLHDKSFVDDPARIVRAVRFEQRFGFKLEAKTMRLMKVFLNSRAAEKKAPARYFSELLMVLKKEPSPFKCLSRLSRLGAMGKLCGGLKFNLSLLSRVEKNLKKVPNEYARNIYLSAITLGMTKSSIDSFLNVFQINRADRKAMVLSHNVLLTIRQLDKKNLSLSKVYEILRPYGVSAVYFLKTCTTRKDVLLHINAVLDNAWCVELKITGEDLKDLGFCPGKAMKKVIYEILLKKIDGKIKNKKDEIKEAKKLIASV